MFQNMIDRHNEAAMAGLHEAQAALSMGDYWVRFVDLDAHPPLVEFGRIWNRADYLANAIIASEVMDEEQVLEADRILAERGLMFGKAYSLLSVRGELGVTHKASVWPIEERLFKAADAAGWNVNLLDVEGRALLEIAFAQHRAHLLAGQAEVHPTRQEIGKAIADQMPNWVDTETLERTVDAIMALIAQHCHH